eukprot:CAMPEP_0119138482 /NCGR_PEP_ID=MMETSP1310-20130426/25732_1 /TAXON_ID=464262 /ORGANISM="Genus nov. species nov., Strain RCC2339" /LENGTH=535 /DNA_ID=CAMNT_0007129677 /DNA_START=63 /DNA_END=1670 /DNA_ORIENTATION=-
MTRGMWLKVVVAVVVVAVVDDSAAFEVFEATVSDIQAAFGNGELSSCAELVGLYVDRIGVYDELLRSLVTVNPNVTQNAVALDGMSSEERAARPLWCIPFVAKDNINKAASQFGMPTTGGSDTLRDSYAEENAVMLQLLLDAGAVLLGSSNMATLALEGNNTYSTVLGQTRNTFDPRRSPMGSSGGTGSAVSASLCAFGLGSDTDGSIQNPANVQSLVGLRPTYNLVPPRGTLPANDWQDTFGPMARSVQDVGMVMNVLDNAKPVRSPVAPTHTYPTLPPAGSLVGVRVGLLNDTLYPFPGDTSPVDPDVRAAVRTIAGEMEALGAEVVILNGVAQQFLRTAMLDSPASVPCTGAEGIGSWSYYFGEEVTAGSPYHNASAVYDAMLANPNETRGVKLAVKGTKALAPYPYAAIYQPSCQAFLFMRQTCVRLLEGEMADNNLDALLYAPMQGPGSLLSSGSTPRTFSSLSAITGNPALVVPAGLSYATDPPMPVGATILTYRFQDARLVAWGQELEAHFPHRQIPTFTPPLSRAAL